MNAKEQVQLEWDQQTAGLSHGNHVAAKIIERWPDGFSDEVSAEISVLVDRAVMAVTNTMKAAGIKRRYREAFSSGYYIGVRNSFSEYASDCGARRAMKETA